MDQKRILVTEEIAEEGLDALRRRGYAVDVMLDASPDELAVAVRPYDALIVRSQTQVTSELLDAAENCKIIGRAGVTVDNIDLDAASERGIVVCNAPTSNIISAAEHTMALLLAAARNIPQANASMHAGRWDRRRFKGRELYGKTLAIFGLGRVGGLVAERARAFGMKLLAYDPYCNPDRAAQLEVKLVDDLDDVLARADFITVHLPLTEDTYGMFGRREFAAMKNGVVLVNAARGGIYDMDALADFLAAGKVAACAVDVFEDEPCLASPLHELEGACLTPHISALTEEAQVRAGVQIAEYVWAGLEGSIVPTAVNSSALPPEVMDAVGPYIPACKMMGRMVSQMLGRIPSDVRIRLEGSVAGCAPDALVAGALDGMLTYQDRSHATLEKTAAAAARHGVDFRTDSAESAGEYASAVRMDADGMEVACTLYGIDRLPRIISIMGYKIDIAPGKESLIFEYPDGPGRIGVIGTVLGDAGVNITTMQIGTKPEERCALVYLNVEGDVDGEVLDALRAKIELKNLWSVRL